MTVEKNGNIIVVNGNVKNSECINRILELVDDDSTFIDFNCCEAVISDLISYIKDHDLKVRSDNKNLRLFLNSLDIRARELYIKNGSK